MANATTRHRWTDFAPHSLQTRGERIVPQRFLGATRWRTVRGDTGYFIDDATRPSCFYPVEFNFAHACWVETTWNPIDRRWDVIRPLGPQYQCDIYEPIPHVSEWCHDRTGSVRVRSLSLGLPPSLRYPSPSQNHALYYKACMTHDPVVTDS